MNNRQEVLEWLKFDRMTAQNLSTMRSIIEQDPASIPRLQAKVKVLSAVIELMEWEDSQAAFTGKWVENNP